MAQPFPAHQGIPQHPGIPPGHPLAPGQHPNAHPGAGMVQQVHPGVSAPGGPQVTQGGPMMGGMPPGAGTTAPGGPVQAHALSHLNPAQAHLFQQPHFAQQFANNPQLMHQQQQQQLLRQRMLFQQQQQQQQQQHGGLPVSMPNGTQPLNAAQLAAMQNPGMRPVISQMQLQQMPHGQPQNIQQQQHFLAMQAQQAQQAQQQQAQQAHQAQQQVQQQTPQPGQQTPQQRPAPQPQNVHDAQSVTPQPQPMPPPHQGSATPQPTPQHLPTSQPPQQPAIPQPQPTPNPPPQQLPQSQQPGQQGQQGQQQQPQQPQQQAQQQPQQPPQPQQPQSQPQPQPQQGQQGQQQGQQQQPQGQQQQGPPMTVQEAQLKAQQQQNAMMMQQRMNMKGATILCLNTFAEQLSNFTSRGEAHDLLYWQSFVDKFYSPSGVLRQGVWNPQTGSKQFEIATPALARYYLTQFTSGIRHIQMVVENARERDSPNGGHIVESQKTSFIYWFVNDTQIFTNGKLRAHFDMNNKIEMLDIEVTSYTEYLPRSQLQALEAADQKQSPKVSKNMGKRAQQKQAQQPAFTLPESMVTANGVPFAVMSFLEVAETISQMQLLFQYSQQNPQLSAPEALRNLVNSLPTQTPTPGFMPAPMNPAMQPGQNPRGPNMNVPNQFASPAMAHLGLPGAQGSPHLGGSAHPSPAQSHLAGPPGMVPQGQMQPNVGQGTSASASPNVSHKRRRASTVKMENDDGAPEVNGTAPPGPKTVKASPRVGGKRQKGTAN
ncbi:LIM-domain binding protein-domain-containing protein [Aspergillus transmontanensis]|nr:LIM-domain binding protein-domain-containing protein [Aspergillus transmontanensis]